MAQLNQRLLSLDVFRGITVAAMILVNNPGSWGNIYAPLEHASWNGCTPTDLIFPFFLFIVGVAISFALGNQKEQKDQHGKIMWRVTKRAITLYALGAILALYPKVFTEPVATLQTLRLPGVLQRIAFVFFFSALIFIKTDTKAQFKIMILCLMGYWALMTFVPVPGVGYANLEPTTNLGAWLDRTLLTPNHLWKASKVWDPEGILSTLPAIGSGLFGILVGTWLKRKDVDAPSKVSWMFTTGILAIVAGLLWDLIFPINKSLWTSSYVFYTGGLATMGLALCYWLIDVQGYTKWTKPFVVYGVNAITVFFGSGIMAKTLEWIKISVPNAKPITLKLWIFKHWFLSYLSPINASLAFAVTFVLLWLLILWVMYNKKIIIKV